MSKRIDSAAIGYDQGLSMECYAVDLTGESVRSVNFLDYLEEDTARDRIVELSRLAVKMSVEGGERYATKIASEANVLTLPDADKVYDLVVGRLGMEPVGKLLYIDDVPWAPSSGLTTYGVRTSLVFRDRIVDTAAKNSIGEEAARALNNDRVAGVAAHELTHLAGCRDFLYFAPNTDLTSVERVLHPSTTLEDWPSPRGGYFEEGLGSLVQNMYGWYFWNMESGLPHKSVHFESPEGVHVEMPYRNTLMAWHDNKYCAWGIERLIAIAPEVWDIMLRSRKYHANGSVIRAALKECVDSAVHGLFDHIDTANIDSLEEKMEVTARIDHEATRRKV